ncbi:F-box/WD repeat-containing protein 7-like [Corticium candelabrum]|uniref:F-box/WD repeat-containing protein 7-like n=1 Tax=Corticium candelabrum TaxID=121492 RepID=UPI002E26B24C|nr:F-box/WD repeat-containing protein 7-like [Corticium candelabrum]
MQQCVTSLLFVVVYCCQFDENRVVSGSADATLRIWDTTTGKTKHVLTGHEAEIYCLQYNDVVIASGSADSSVRVWNHQGLCLHELKEHLGIVRCLHLTRTRLVTGGDVRKIIIWDTERGEMCNIIHRNPTSLHQMWVDDTRLITASPDAPGTITIINFW